MKKYKKSSDVSYSIGVYPTLELLYHRPDKVDSIIISGRGDRNEGLNKIIEICQKKKIRVEQSDKAINRIAKVGGCYAVGIFYKYHSPLQKGDHLVLVNPNDMGNFGTITRTMLAYGIKNLAVIKPAVDIFAPKAVRASMGAIFKLNFSYFDSFSDYCSAFKNNNIYPLITNAKTGLDQAVFKKPFSLVFGGEGAGLGEEFLKVGESIKIPQSREVDSLNLSVAVGIVLYASSLDKNKR
ncbi:MAG: TrmH family RNA methyltransferase [Patescibacteria group bacterium]|nr:TrmH family RNA methyltransferase [Patescibacteria group bacterium]